MESLSEGNELACSYQLSILYPMDLFITNNLDNGSEISVPDQILAHLGSHPDLKYLPEQWKIWS